ncbi:sigma-54-dependent transcriptional regulator [Haematobacter missouriensis]|uniref:sigma-54-dependent transcriptional regulator n=1 Tax=Haematobacter missouriensis TaxID=366616 RepID=UPI0005572C4E|nr:sigma-54 dependent transcriptional regulator [Haematobacter missouriensis]
MNDCSPKTGTPVLLIEDTPSLRLVYESALKNAGLPVLSVATAADGLRAFRSSVPCAVLLDLMLPDREGIDLLAELRVLRPETPVIVITANGSVNKAVEAMRAGATDFLVKPFDAQRLLSAIENLHIPLPATPNSNVPPGEFIGSSPAMRQIYQTIRAVAPSTATVFITGESGTGKELAAMAIHEGSRRAAGPFIALNCGAIPPDLLESEVFGHLRGSFTGALSDRAGAAAAADGGTLFLDEICEMDLALQTKLLRFLQTSTIQPVGASRPRKVNVRILCATNRDPLEAVRQGRFREDLYYRLHVIPLHMPPLREREQDIAEIAGTLLQRLSREEGRSFTALDEDVLRIFRAAPWPGNVRQLLNVLRNIVVLHEGTVVTARMLPQGFKDVPNTVSEPPRRNALEALADCTLAEAERMVIEAAICRHGGSIPKAARALDVSPSTLYRKIELWGKPLRVG